MKVRETISPYRSLLGEFLAGIPSVLSRAQWDARAESRRSRARLLEFKDSFRGKTVVVVCNGPSLLKTDFELLRNTPTIGLNKINLLFERNAFRPSFIVCVNELVLRQNAEFFAKADIPLFLGHKGLAWVKPRPGIAYLHTVARHHKFARDVSSSVNEGSTVTFVALQLAYHMGFTKVALIGCDHNFATKGKPNSTVVAQGPDKSHFDPNYFGQGTSWQLPDLEGSEMAYLLARHVFESSGREIVNCTEGGRLDIFPRRALADWI